MMTIHPRQDPRWAGLVIGPLIVLLGIVLLLDQTGLLGWHPSWSIWPFLLIGLGLSRLAMDGRPGGGWLVAVGAWLLLDEMRILRVRDSWPLLLVAFGVHHIWKALRHNRTRRPQGQSS